MARRTRELGPGIGRRLKQAREAAGLTVIALAEKAHTTPKTIQDLTNGLGGNSGVGLLTDVAKALGVHPCWLLYGEDPTQG